MKHILFILTALVIFLACNPKADNPNSNDYTEQNETSSDINTIDSTQVELSSEEDSLQMESTESDKDENSVLETEEKTKIIPKEEVKPTEAEVESVPVSVPENKIEENKTPPRPEIKEISEKVEQVEVKTNPDQTIIKEQAPPKNDHSEFDEFLRNYVTSDGQVSYKSMLSNVGTLDNYLSDLEGTELASLNRNQQLSFWINAYNAYTIKLILNNYPINSIKDISKPWDKKWIVLDGRKLSLNNIEHDIIRPQFNDARIHFAVNCAAKSCPPLLNRAYDEHNVESFLEKQTQKFVNDSSFNIISEDKIQISKIFDWYNSDFGDVKKFIEKYSNKTIDQGVEITYLEYDWSLNK